MRVTMCWSKSLPIPASWSCARGSVAALVPLRWTSKASIRLRSTRRVATGVPRLVHDADAAEPYLRGRCPHGAEHEVVEVIRKYGLFVI
jgi:hypothetical protein